MTENNAVCTQDSTHSTTNGTRTTENLRKFGALMKIANVRYLATLCNTSSFLLCLLFVSLLSNFVVGEIVHELQNGSGNNLTSNRSEYLVRRLFGNGSGNGYNGNRGESGKKFGGGGEGRMCWKERGKREIGRKRKQRSNDRTRASGSMYEAQEDGIEWDSACIREERRSRLLEGIKKSILSKLGMSQPPSLDGRHVPKIEPDQLAALLNRKRMHDGVDGVVWIPQHGLPSDPYRDFRNESGFSTLGAEAESSVVEEDDYHVRTEKIVTFAQERTLLILDPRVSHSPYVQFFEFSDNVRSSRVKRAVLWVYIRGRDNVEVAGDKIKISIYKIRYAGGQENTSQGSLVITPVLNDLGQFVPKGKGAWITLDYLEIKKLVVEWFNHPLQNLGIIITADDVNGTNLAVTSPARDNTSYVPFLELYVEESKKHRVKRTVGLSCTESSNESRCCKYPLKVNFEEFGWDWIIAPRKYEANVCFGECPFVFLTHHPHTHLMQLANIPGVGPCCSPRKLSDIYMVYFDQNLNIVQGMVPGMVVERCGCD